MSIEITFWEGDIIIAEVNQDCRQDQEILVEEILDQDQDHQK